MEYNLEDEEFQEIIVLVAVVIVVLPIVLHFVFGEAGREIFSIIVSSLLTLALVLLYFQQSTILDKQTQLMGRDYQSLLKQQGKLVADGDTVRFKLRNAGRGKVHRLYLRSEITSDTGEVAVDSGRVVVQSVEDESEEIESKSEWEWYEADVSFRIPSIGTTDSDRHFPFKFLCNQLSREGIDSANLKLTVEVVDEGIAIDNFSYTFTLAEQEVSIPEPIAETINGSEQTRPVSASLEEILPHDYSSAQDITRVSFEELAE